MFSVKLIIFVLGIILAVIFTLPIITLGILNTGNYMGLLIAALFILYGIFFNQTNRFIVNFSKQTTGKVIIILFLIIVVSLLSFAVIIGINIIAKADRPTDKETTVVVLGCRVRKNGASMMLRTRLEAAYVYLTENPKANCVLSGGKGEDEPIAESKYMYDWLVSKGIAEERLYIEDKSTSTEENLIFVKKIIEENGLIPEITIITNEFHQYRAYRFARENGIESYSYCAKTPFTVLPTYFIREICGVAHMIFIK